MLRIEYNVRDRRGRTDFHYADIWLTKGDTLIASVTLALTRAVEYVPSAEDVVKFVVKKRRRDAEALIEQEIDLSTMLLEVDADATASLKSGDYAYYIEITYADGVVDTFLSGTLHLMEK